MYTAVVLDAESVAKLMAKFEFDMPDGWTVKAHHMTTNMGKAANGPAAAFVGQTVDLKVVSLARDNKVMAVGVECEVPSVNTHKHVTLAVNEAGGGKAKQSNDLTEWLAVQPFTLRGTVTEVS